MGINYSCPGPDKLPEFEFLIRPEFCSTGGKDYYIELYWNLENASIEERSHITSLILPVYLESTSKENINLILNDYIFNPNIHEILVFLARDIETQETEGMTVIIIQKHFFIKNDFSKENEFYIVSNISSVKQKARKKGIYREIANLEVKLLSEKFTGKNFAYFDLALNPFVYKKLSKHFLLYPNPNVETPDQIRRFMLRLMKKFEFTSVSQENPFVVKDWVKLERIDREYWIRNYANLSRELQFFIDQTQLRDSFGLLYFTPGRLIQRNTLGLPEFEIPLHPDLEPKVLLKECFFSRPKL